MTAETLEEFCRARHLVKKGVDHPMAWGNEYISILEELCAKRGLPAIRALLGDFHSVAVITLGGDINPMADGRGVNSGWLEIPESEIGMMFKRIDKQKAGEG